MIRKTETLRYIGVLATGFNVVDVKAAKARGIPVCNVSNYGSKSVAQGVFAHILNFSCRVAPHGADVAAGGWTRSPDFCYWKWPLTELDGLTSGVMGLGEIGQATARLGKAFGMRVVATGRDRSKPLPEGMSWLDLDELFRQSDFVSLHCPLTSDTERLVSRDRIALMRPTAFLINPRQRSTI